jgi:3-methylcrotonyl-CoA carboxylase beta subunit
METVGKSVNPECPDRIDRKSNATFSSARLWNDGVIPPFQTRHMLGLGLKAALGGRVDKAGTHFEVFNVSCGGV